MDYSDQQNEIFRTCCTISKRVCDLIIDIDSVENIASLSKDTSLLPSKFLDSRTAIHS